LLLAASFGVAMSVFKGNGAGVRDDIGNLSAPWLLVPFFAAGALPGRRLLTGALVGMAATCTALAAFYVANAFVLDLGPHGVLGAGWRRRGFSYAGIAVTADRARHRPAPIR
jgi:hypothetical protein